jgi:threonine synthase
MAKSLGYKRIVVSSTGNHGAAMAAYAAAAGLTCVVLCAPAAPPAILEQVRAYGALPIVITGGDRFSLVEYLVAERGWFPGSLFLPTAVHNPFGIEGYKTLAYEIVRDLGVCPAAVVFPCARGNGLYGAWKGFTELRRLGVIAGVPRMIACQPAAANTLERSAQAGRVVRIDAPVSIAASITEEVAAPEALEAIQLSGGDAVSVDDATAVEAARHIAAEGLWVETSSAVPVAALPVLRARGIVRPDDVVVVVLTGAGIKWAGTGGAAPAARIQGRPEELERCLAREGITP